MSKAQCLNSLIYNCGLILNKFMWHNLGLEYLHLVPYYVLQTWFPKAGSIIKCSYVGFYINKVTMIYEIHPFPQTFAKLKATQ